MTSPVAVSMEIPGGSPRPIQPTPWIQVSNRGQNFDYRARGLTACCPFHLYSDADGTRRDKKVTAM